MSAFEPELHRGVALLEASAGTGKTHWITDLCLRLVALDGLPVESILVVTFTEAAAAELRDRVRSRLRSALSTFAGEAVHPPIPALPAEAEARLRTALQDFDEAPIHTIHAFCRRVLERHAFESGAELGFGVLGDPKPLLRDLATDFWISETCHAPRFVFDALSTAKTVADRDRLARMFDERPQLRVAPHPAYVERPDARAWVAARRAARTAWREAGADACSTLDAAGLPRRTPALTRDFAHALEAWFAGADIPSDQIPEAVAYFATAAEFGLDHPALLALARFQRAHANLDAAMNNAHSALPLRLQRFVVEQRPIRAARRRLRTYADLLHGARRAVREAAPLRAALRRTYRAALVDEFQDTDDVQWAFFSEVFGDAERPLYLVGDPKQAIYSFRGADLPTYLRARGAERTRLLEPLALCFRGDPALVRAQNHLFGRPPSLFPDGIPFASVDAARTDSRLGGAAPVALRLVPRERARCGKRGHISSTAYDDVGALVAADIAAELAGGVTYEGRPLTAADIAVLVRQHKQAAAVRDALRRVGIPAVVRAQGDVFESPASGALQRVMSAALDPTPNAVRGALATPLLGADADDLVRLEDDEDGWGRVVGDLRRWHTLWLEQGFVRFFRALLDEGDVRARLLATPEGDRDLTDLLHLGELLHETSVRERLRPAALLAWLVEGGPTVEEEKRELRLERDGDAVRVLTIHASKGLQYPVVYCPFLWRDEGMHSKDKEYLLDRRADGPVLDLRPDRERREAVRRAVAAQSAEEIRLAYVALTRAQARCVVYWGGFNKAKGSPLAHILGPSCDPGRSDGFIFSGLEALATADIEVGRAGEVAAEVPEPPRPPLTLRPFDRGLDATWRRTSFSALTRDAEHESAVADEPPDDAEDEALAGETPLARIPGGARVGTFLHWVLEHVDFTRAADELRPKVEEGVERFGLSERLRERAGLSRAQLADTLTAALHDVLNTPLDGSLRLADLPRERRLDELDFFFPLAGGYAGAEGLDPSALAGLLAKHGGDDLPASYPARLAELDFHPLRGFMNGSIDLVFEHAGRWYVVDYKSNRLGERFADYAPARLADEMARSHYVLQYHLYSVALHRYLERRLPEYDPDEHFGGVYYLFLRGMHPDHHAGVFVDRPSGALLRALSEGLG